VAVGVAFAVLLGAATPWLAAVFTDAPGVQDLATQLLVIVALLQPLNALVFVLDGVLIGAGDQRYLAGAMLAATFLGFVPAAGLVVGLHAGVVALWAALTCWFAARALGVGVRYLGRRWQVTGAVRA
jgi:Na+-driven multidrug efflux pump